MGPRRYLLAGLALVLAVGMGTQDAQAFWGSRGCCGYYGSSWGYSGWYGGGWGCGGCYSDCCGNYGGRWLRRANYGSWGNCGCCSPCSSCCTTCCSSCVTCDSGCGCGGSGDVYQGEVTTPTPTPSPSNSTMQPTATVPMTMLTLHVPADARVTLAGVATRQQGEVRTYSTAGLPAGQTWQDYQVVAEIERNGQVDRQQHTITLTGGQSQQLSIEFPSPQLAQVSR